MKAEECPDSHLDKLPFPVICSPKIDGIRAMKVNGHLLSSTFKPIPNMFTRETLERQIPDGADGELTVGSTFQETTSGIMSKAGEPAFTFWMFDLVNPDQLDEPYSGRILNLHVWKARADAPNVVVVPTQLIYSVEELLEYEEEMLNLGYEGAMVRKLDGPYKCGRSTLKQGWLLKRKPFEDSEARITGFEEQLTNTNEMETNELGLSKRSSAKAGKVGNGTLGKFIAEDIHGKFPGVSLKIGTGKGLTHELRAEVWNNYESYVGKIIKYKFQRMGVKDAPRLPIFLGFRHPEDITT